MSRTMLRVGLAVVVALSNSCCGSCLSLAVKRSGGAAASVAMNDSSIVYSPFNWHVDGGVAKTINAGAYFRVIFSGQTAVLHTNTSGSHEGPYSQFWTRVDGGPLQQHTLAPGNPDFPIALGPPFSASPNHLLEVIVKSTSETIDRWNQQTTAVVFTGLSFDAGAAVRAPVRKPKTVLIYGDSITEGVRTLGFQNIANDTDRNDAVRDYSYQLCQMLPCEVGIVAFGASGLTKGGSGSVPALPESWDMLWADQPRHLASAPVLPDLVIYNEGTNDGDDITSAFTTVVLDVHKAAPNATQLLLRPFNGAHTSDADPQIQNVVKNVAGSSSIQIFYGDTTGFYSGEDGLHPFGYNHVGSIAPNMAALVAPLLL
eukprot:INCI8538.2.p1 GENE.INCI8538.2~~INCI8538.2.p1  ORF type:complete len:371 (-),score=54.98 INCI8538.2:142-1254(-)